MNTVGVPRLRDRCVAHLIESDGPGGAERMLASLATALQAAGSRSIVFAPADREGWLARELSGSDVRVESFRLERPFSPAFARWLADKLRQHRVDVAHSHEFTMAMYGAWGARRAGIPHLFTMHGGRYYAERIRRRIALRIAAAWSGAVVAVSESLAEHLRRDLWLRASRVITIPNGARGGAGMRSTLRNELHLADGDHLAVAVGNLYPVKGHAYLVEALGLLAARLPQLHVAIAGRGEREGDLRARAEALNIGDRFHLLGLRADVGNVLAGADVFVLPSLSEGVPLALLEAMLAARPIVATAVGEVPTVLADGRAGVLVPPGDAAALARALGDLLSDPPRARRLSAAAVQRAIDEYSFDRMMQRYTALYGSLLSSAHHPDPSFEAREVSGFESAVRRHGTQALGE